MSMHIGKMSMWKYHMSMHIGRELEISYVISYINGKYHISMGNIICQWEISYIIRENANDYSAEHNLETQSSYSNRKEHTPISDSLMNCFLFGIFCLNC